MALAEEGLDEKTFRLTRRSSRSATGRTLIFRVNRFRLKTNGKAGSPAVPSL
ncbi:hypothetical protein PO124_28530 [Bacillus licheniformis]|nr:hypothetical protein [Bacillus licheniformis]